MNLFRELRYDLPGGVVVAFVAVPLCLGIALASGAPLFAGLIAGIVGGIVVGALSGSPLGVSGPAAGLAVIVAGAIETLGGFEVFLVAVVLAGLLQIGLGALGGGVIAYFFPSSVIKGMLSGIGLLIILKQIPHAVGWDAVPEGDFSFVQPDGGTTISSIGSAFGNIEPVATAVAVVALAILIVWERWLTPRGGLFALIQGPLVVVVLGGAFEYWASTYSPQWSLSSEHLVQLPEVESLAGLATLFVTPDWSMIGDRAVWVVAVTLAIVASIETLLCVEATDKLDPQRRVTPTNRELVAQGVGNTLSGLIGGLPLTQVIVRSSANIQSGARTKLSAIFHGVLLLAFVVAIPQLLNYVPLAVLASILFVVGYKLAKPSLFKEIYRSGKSQFGPFIATIAGILLTDLLVGVGIGMAVGVSVVLYRNYIDSHSFVVEERDSASGHFATIEFGENVTFISRGEILRRLEELKPGTLLTVDLRRSRYVDHDVREILDEFIARAPERDVKLEVLEPQDRTFVPQVAAS